MTLRVRMCNQPRGFHALINARPNTRSRIRTYGLYRRVGSLCVDAEMN